MGLDCEYPNSCSCGCQDEPRHTGCKFCGRETKHSDDCLIPENARLRAALAKVEAERDENRAEADHAWIRVTQETQRAEMAEIGLAEIVEARIAEKSRADRYLAAMAAYVDARIADGVCIAQDGEPMPVAFERTELAIRAIRALVEEARHG